jgi:Protein of unknown function (DUF1592)/Protein of unknown function (DUF1588)/Protein of unknown function (DUF1587)/Protein of unknown function (DUF1595)/Protein of unknown function (DUF1585)/Planctomycete cytochrome C
MRVTFAATVLLLASQAAAAEPTGALLEDRFRDAIRPFLQSFCFECHDKQKHKGDLDLSAYSTLDSVAKDYRRWDTVREQLQAVNMPPEKAKAHPTAERRREVLEWIADVRRYEATRHAGDPGRVPARRLSNAEYDYTIRDLTGVDIRPAREFPVDPANEAGFDNSAESLAMSPALVKKYLEAARRVAEHLVLKPDGFDFALHGVVADTDRDKYCVRRIIEFYRRQPTDYAAYFHAAWRFRHRAALGNPNASLADVAAAAKVSAKYLATIWKTLTETPDEIGPVAALRAVWNELPPPDAKLDAVRAGCERMRDFVVGLRRQLVPEVKNLPAPGMQNGSQPLVLWKNREMAGNRMRYAGGALQVRPAGLDAELPAAKALTPPTEAADVEKYESTFRRFCEVFPDAFMVTERARIYLDPEKEKSLRGRLLSAGFHSMTGFFRDDGPLYQLILDADGQRELDRLWVEFDFITGAPIRQYTSFIWYERAESHFTRGPEFDFARSEDKDCTSPAKIKQLAEVYLDKVRRNGAGERNVQAVVDHFKIIEASIRRVEEGRLAAEPSHLAALQAFAERAYRRPLSANERDDLIGFYRSLRATDGLTHEEAVREALVSVLMSPHFCYRLDLSPSGRGVRPLSDVALASRLSYFLWSSMPDAQLLRHAAVRDLHRPEVLLAQTRRMLRDDRIRGLATEFAGNWLDCRRFEEHNAVDRERFPGFTDELRSAMFEEPVRFFVDLVHNDRSVLECLYGNHTFVNAALARHYDMPEITGGRDEWVRIDEAQRYGRGGLLPMAVFMTKNAPGLRTSPVKRGYWVVRRLLGETIPAPPAQVPELPNDEAKVDLPLRELLARHRAEPSCAKCHDRFDSFGLVFEGYGPVGERRTNDLGGRPVETRAAFPGGSEGVGLDVLRTYIRERRQTDFVDNLCRKLLSYALGRSLLPSDDATIEQMRAKLAANGYRFNILVETIVTGPQFLNVRGDEPAKD